MKTMAYWVGLILVGFGIWVSFIGLWLYMSMYFWRLGNISILAILLVGGIIFIVIGWRMMKEDR